MDCQRCNSDRVLEVNSKSSDCNGFTISDKEYIGYVRSDLKIGGGDYIEFSYCLDCGQIQGEFPIPETELERGELG